MKTIREWFAEGITRLRQPKWNEWAYIEISGTPDGLLHPWAKVYDVGCGDRPIPIGLWVIQDELFDEWKPPIDYEQKKDEIYK